MISRLISSLQHPLVKKFVKLKEKRSFRLEEGSAIVVGETVVREISKTCKIKTLISQRPLPFHADTSFLATEEILQKIIGHKTDDLVAAEVTMPPPSDLSQASYVVVLDQVQDPGNVGTIFRTALALGWDGVFVIEGSADPYNDKALRASRGAPLRLPWCEGTWDEVPTESRQIIIADTQGTPLSKMTFSKPLLLVLGHETKGPSETARQLGKPVTIPMKGEMESLNVAAAAAIMLYEVIV